MKQYNKYKRLKALIRVALMSVVKGMLVLLIVNVSAQTIKIDDVESKTKSIAGHKKAAISDTSNNNSKGAIIPVPFIITDQNLGYGGVLALGYLHPNKKKTNQKTPPAITGIAGGATSNKTWAVLALHSHSWNYDRLRYLGGVIYADVNLDFYQIGDIDISDHPIEVNLRTWGTVQRMHFRIKKSNFFIGPQYGFLSVDAGINLDDNDHPLIDSLIRSINDHTYLSELGLLFSYDNRDNTLAPTKGFNAGFSLNYNTTLLGASQNFVRSDVFFYKYVPFTKWLYSIYHFDAQFSGGDLPFYMVPYIELRGVPIMRYQGNQTIIAEAQLRGYFYRNLALVAFCGTGKAFDEFQDFGSSEWVYNYGTGFRWEIKKIFGIRTGIDVAWSNRDFGWYVVIGTGL